MYTVNWLCCQVVIVMSHELAHDQEMDSYFAEKFYPARPLFVLGRSYRADRQCKPEETLYNNWMDPFHSHA